MEPAIVTVLGSEAEILRNPAAPLFDDGVECRLEAVAIGWMEDFQPVAGRAFERAALEAEQVFRVGAGMDAVALRARFAALLKLPANEFSRLIWGGRYRHELGASAV